MKKKNTVWEVIKFVLIFFIFTLVWLVVFAACNGDAAGTDYEPFPGASLVFSLVTTLFCISLVHYNYLQRGKQAIDAAYHNVKVQVEKRDSLLKKANELISGYMKHEETVFSSRKEIDYSNIAFLVENYPDLKANHSVTELLKQIDTCENAIAYRKEAYNNLVNQFNSAIHSFPMSLLAGLFRFKDARYYENKKNSWEGE
ncbi:MAG: LemA family protein [Candidatus Heteroscillospira sp.]